MLDIKIILTSKLYGMNVLRFCHLLHCYGRHYWSGTIFFAQAFPVRVTWFWDSELISW